MKTHTGLIPALMIFLIAFGGSAVVATEKISEQEELECQACHVDPETELLSDQGLYYQYLRTLQGYEQVMERFGSCTYCHVDEPGSAHLTRQGQRFRWMMEDMVGLRAWLDEYHPKPTEEDEDR